MQNPAPIMALAVCAQNAEGVPRPAPMRGTEADTATVTVSDDGWTKAAARSRLSGPQRGHLGRATVDWCLPPLTGHLD